MIKILLTLFLTIGILQATGNAKIKSFSKAKKIMKNKIYNTKNLQYGFYSQCTYESKKIKNNKYKLVVNKESCNYKPRKPKNKRSNYIRMNGNILFLLMHLDTI